MLLKSSHSAGIPIVSEQLSLSPLLLYFLHHNVTCGTVYAFRDMMMAVVIKARSRSQVLAETRGRDMPGLNQTAVFGIPLLVICALVLCYPSYCLKLFSFFLFLHFSFSPSFFHVCPHPSYFHLYSELTYKVSSLLLAKVVPFVNLD